MDTTSLIHTNGISKTTEIQDCKNIEVTALKRQTFIQYSRRNISMLTSTWHTKVILSSRGATIHTSQQSAATAAGSLSSPHTECQRMTAFSH